MINIKHYLLISDSGNELYEINVIRCHPGE